MSYQEIAARSWAEAIALTERLGLGVPQSAMRSKGVWVFRFEVLA